MTIQDVANGQRFCVRCGTALDGGRCALHGYDIAGPGAGRAASLPPSIHNSAWSTPPVEPSWQRRVAPEPPPSHPAGSRAPRVGWVAAGIAVLLLIALIGDHFYLQSALDSNHRRVAQLDQRLAAQLAVTNALGNRVGSLETKAPDSAAVARQVRSSVFTIDTPDGLGSGWVSSSAAGSSSIVTDYHVIGSVWTGGGAHTVQVKQDNKSFTGTITKVDPGDDLAIITVKQALTPLPRSTTDAMIGDAVLVVGSPLGLSGTVASGIVSSFRNGLIQFSAPISPGDSGGPVVNRLGQVIGVAESKLVGSGVEGLSFAIPISTVCSTVATC